MQQRRPEIAIGLGLAMFLGLLLLGLPGPAYLVLFAALGLLCFATRLGPASQIGIATASTFTLIAFLIALRTRLPAVGYLTQLDKLSVYSTVLVFIALGEVVVTSSLAQRGRQRLARRLDVHARWIYLLAFAAGLTLVLAA